MIRLAARVTAALFCLGATAWGQADRDEDLVATLGGKIRELAAVLSFNTAEEKTLADLFDALQKEVDDHRARVIEKGTAAVAQEYGRWQEEARGRLRGTLRVDQRGAYDGYLTLKKRISAEFEKALFGIPPVTELKLRIGLDESAVEAMARAADGTVASIKKKVGALKKGGSTQEDLARAINDERRLGIELMIDAAKGPAQAKVKAYVKDYLRAPVEKLSRADRAALDRTIKGLGVKDPAREQSSRRLVAAILMHRAENMSLRAGMSRDVLLLMMTKKNEGEMWVRMSEYQGLITIHDRRLKDLYDDAKSLFTSPEIARLVSEGVLE